MALDQPDLMYEAASLLTRLLIESARDPARAISFGTEFLSNNLSPDWVYEQKRLVFICAEHVTTIEQAETFLPAVLKMLCSLEISGYTESTFCDLIDSMGAILINVKDELEADINNNDRYSDLHLDISAKINKQTGRWQGCNFFSVSEDDPTEEFNTMSKEKARELLKQNYEIGIDGIFEYITGLTEELQELFLNMPMEMAVIRRVLSKLRTEIFAQ